MVDTGAYLQSKDVNGSLVRGATEPFVPQAEVDAVERRLVRPTPQFHQHDPPRRIPYSYQRPLSGGTGNHGTLPPGKTKSTLENSYIKKEFYLP